MLSSYIHYYHHSTMFLPSKISNTDSAPTIQDLVDEDEVVLDVVLGDFAKVVLHDLHHLVQELEHHGGVDILLGDGRHPDVGTLYVEETGAGDVGHR